MTVQQQIQPSSDEPTYELARDLRGISLRRSVATIASLSLTASMLIALAWWLRSHPFESFDVDGVASISGWNWPASDSILNTIAFVTDARAGAVVGILAVLYLFASGRSRLAFGLGVAGIVVGARSRMVAAVPSVRVV